jgi:hypothetical protein
MSTGHIEVVQLASALPYVTAATLVFLSTTSKYQNLEAGKMMQYGAMFIVAISIIANLSISIKTMRDADHHNHHGNDLEISNYYFTVVSLMAAIFATIYGAWKVYKRRS